MNQPTSSRWRTIDIVVAAVIAVGFGVIFWAWGLLWRAADPAFAFFPASQALMYGVWLVPAVLGGLVIRKPGAALFCEAVAATVSALLGSEWGGITIVQGLIQGLGAELAFAAFRYRSFRLPTALLAGALTGLGAALFDFFVWNAPYALVSYRIPYALLTVLSATVIAGAGAHLLTRALAGTGVLARFPSGRDRPLV
ncbi:energy-coupling factor transport system substrate-specific component [Micromonospora phaseoli]|uniref:Energy-coupling factor transport system substrate-specific component n=1 Tax=Micromonospora phaseoli TaxID=1144548 RepID=A0A1H7CGM9_9ACTN|nr:ECF transporter S component [Micromonospora phaseoli]PZV97807.1 energy-coupling factor transport system substrate-specific component [Micromonospora phaseoli]GIJ78457.1 ABC transporter permease [Micromonospora phaseoli]SEJ88768.1 energy-coupling factor transport system substrate-specific component [Micromonospora phaseoli]